TPSRASRTRPARVATKSPGPREPAPPRAPSCEAPAASPPSATATPHDKTPARDQASGVASRAPCAAVTPATRSAWAGSTPSATSPATAPAPAPNSASSASGVSAQRRSAGGTQGRSSVHIGLRRRECFDQADEDAHRVLVEREPGRRREVLERGGVGQSRTIGPVRRERVVDIRDGDDARAERNLVAGQAVRVAGAVPPLVVVTDHQGAAREEIERRDDLRADQRMLAHHRPFLGVAHAGLPEAALRDTDLADAVAGAARA